MSINKLYPPKLSTSLPAMSSSDNITLALTVPFQMNNAVSKADIKHLVVLIKTVSTGVIKEEGVISTSFTYDTSLSEQIATFILDKSKYTEGQYYKIQIAFVNQNNEVGFYSSVGIIKYAVYPTVFISQLDYSVLNNSQYEYTGVYKIPLNATDTSEKVYSYCFTLRDESGTIIDTSGVLLHNSNNDIDSYESFDTWSSIKMLDENHSYTIEYSITTLNGLKITSLMYMISPCFDDVVTNNGEFIAILDSENANINLQFNDDATSPLRAGKYIITRSDSKDNFAARVELISFNIDSNRGLIYELFNDYSIEQGISYKYYIQFVKPSGQLTYPLEATYYNCKYDAQKKINIMTSCIVEFEDAYLFDGERQLIIKYNPKIASFKNVLLESKIDTIGGQYPFIFRNGNVNYKEFSISGLISATMDVDGQFLSISGQKDSFRTKTPSIDIIINNTNETNLSRDNFRKEREFKMEVLRWLSNGKPKLFRSPSEGNYIIRTINFSLSPNDILSRMLHTFTCTAYEIAEYNLPNLKNYGFIKNPPTIINTTTQFKTISLNDLLSQPQQTYNFNDVGGLQSITFNEQYSTLVLGVVYYNGNIMSYNIGNLSGVYTIETDNINNNPIVALYYIRGCIDGNATAQCKYFIIQNTSSSYIKVYSSAKVVLTTQFIGTVEQQTTNLITTISDIRQQPIKYHMVKAVPKQIIPVQFSNDKWYYADGEEITTSLVDYWDSTAIYHDTKQNIYYMGKPNTNNSTTTLNYNFSINSVEYSVLDMIENISNGPTSASFRAITNIENIDTLFIGNAVVCDIVYDAIVKEYSVEKSPLNEKYPKLIEAKTIWRYNPTYSTYQDYIKELNNAIAQQEEGVVNDI